MIGIKKEMLIFLAAVLTGGFLRVAYRILECFRELVRHSARAVGIEDLIYWIFAELYLFVQIYHTSSGSIRWYYALGVGVGAIFMSWIFRKIKKISKKIYTTKT